MVESHLFAPARLVVALLAGRPQLACMSVVLLVTGDAGCSELFLIEIAGVAGFASGGRVAPLKRKFCPGMIETHRLPLR